MLWLALHIDTIYSGLSTKSSEIKSISCVFAIYSTICSGEMAWDTIYCSIPSFSQNQYPSLEGGAGDEAQTHNLLITGQLRYQLRYASILNSIIFVIVITVVVPRKGLFRIKASIF